MAKKSMIARDVKRAKLVDKYAEKRAELKKRIAAGDMEAMFELNKLPKDSSAVRKIAGAGLIPGVKKSSWQLIKGRRI